MHYLDKLKDMLCRELEEFSNSGQVTAGSLETIQKLTSAIKNIDKMKMFDQYEDGDYSRNAASYRRDERGRYARTHDGDYSGRRTYSRGTAKDKLIDQIEGMMNGANDTERMELRRAMEALEKIN